MMMSRTRNSGSATFRRDGLPVGPTAWSSWLAGREMDAGDHD